MTNKLDRLYSESSPWETMSMVSPFVGMRGVVASRDLPANKGLTPSPIQDGDSSRGIVPGAKLVFHFDVHVKHISHGS